MKIFKNKFFIVTLSVALFLTILTTIVSIMGQTDPIKDAINTIAYPFQYAANAVVESVKGFSRYFTFVDTLYDENESLKAEMERLEAEIIEGQAAKEENARLRDYLEMKEKYSSFKLTEALIIGFEGEGRATFLTVNKGKNDGIDIGMAVIVKSGLVGSVCEVGSNWSRVRVMNEASSAAGAYVQRSGENGVVCGDIAYKDKGYCTLKYLKDDADVMEGDLVYTSGRGSVYPGDILIGKIISVKEDGFSRTKVATVECAVDFDSLKYVVIVTESGGDE